MIVREMLETHPQARSIELDEVADCVEACIDCAASCSSCADADLGEPDVQALVRCVRLCTDCADICEATGRVVIRQATSDTSLVQGVLAACVTACRACRMECERHAEHHEHCRLCAQVCGRCEQACNDLLSTMS